MKLTNILKKSGFAYVTTLIIAWTIVLNVFFFARFDIDSYHDGFIYPMALLSSEGKLPNKDFFSFYGPLGPLVQGTWLKVFGSSLFILRMHGALLIILIGLLMFLLCRKQLGISWSLIITSIWMISHPLIVNPSLPWPDLYVTLIQLVALLYLTHGKSELKTIHYFVLGFILSVAVMAKINALLPAAFTMILLIYAIRLRKAISVLIGFLTGISMFSLIMMKFNIFGAFYEQTILYNFNRYDEGKSIRGIFNLKILVYGIILAVTLVFIRNMNNRLVSHKNLLSFFSILASLVLFAVSWKYRQIAVPFSALEFTPQAAAQNFLKNSPYWLLFGVSFLAILYGMKFLVRKSRNEASEIELIFAAVSLSSFLLLYPNPEPAHIWYMIPTGVVGVIKLSRLDENDPLIRNIGFLILLPSFMGLFAVSIQYLQIPRENHQIEFLKPMKSVKANVISIDKTLQELDSNVGSQKMQNNCVLGLFAVPGNSYVVSDFQYVDLTKPFGTRKIEAPYAFECDVSKERLELIRRSYEILFIDNGYFPYEKSVLYVKQSQKK